MRIGLLLGIQMAPPEMAEVPPYLSLFSMTSTDNPRSWARHAVSIAPAPEPTTMTSYSVVSLVLIFVVIFVSGQRRKPQSLGNRTCLHYRIVGAPSEWTGVQ